MNNNLAESFCGDILASRWSRLWASLIDGIIALLYTIPVMSYLGIWESAMQGEVVIPLDATIKLVIFGWVMFFAIHGHLLGKYGQTVGKKLLGISIVTLDGVKPDFWPLIAKRYLPLALVVYIPFIGSYLSTGDVLFIFRKDKRCVHDLIAGTVVINSKANANANADANETTRIDA